MQRGVMAKKSPAEQRVVPAGQGTLHWVVFLAVRDRLQVITQVLSIDHASFPQ
jgi:hypothetical protein